MIETNPIPQQDWLGHTIAGRYKLEAILGQGGMSTVYKATDPNLRRAVAVKLIHPHLSRDPQFVRRFEQEAAAVAQLRHPNIIQVYDYNHEDNLYYMVLEYVPGETLQARLETLNAAKQHLSLDKAVQIMITMCDAVAYAHKQSMIHRDLKPANVMLNPQDEPILMDFGVAKILNETNQTATGVVVGTAKYMSPEQARGVRPDERADIYSLGVMFYEMLTGQPPFDGESAVTIMMKHVNAPVPDVRKIQNEIPDELIAVVQKALAKSAAKRYQTAAEMATALRVIRTQLQFASASGQGEAGESPEEETWMSSRNSSTSSVSQPALPAQSKPDRLALGVLGAGVLILLLGGGLVLLLLLYEFILSPGAISQALASFTKQPMQVAAATEHLPSAEGMVKIKAGTYTVGLKASDSTHAPPQQVKLDEFWIDRYETTNAQYVAFLAASGQKPPASWTTGKPPAGQENHPVEGLTWDMATAYCQWANKRLPTEAEWEVAARGAAGLLYPWGNDRQAVTLPAAGSYPVGSIAENRSPFGVYDMAGNVWEWVDKPYAPVEAGNRVMRGGAYGFLQDMAYRLQGDPTIPTMSATAGVRCAADKVNIKPAVVLYKDDFTNPNSGWPEQVTAKTHVGYHPADFYHVEVSAPNQWVVVSHTPVFSDAVVESNMFIDHTNTKNGNFRYGLVVRRSGDQFYAFTVSARTKAWWVLRHAADGLQVLDEGDNNSVRGFGQDAADTLRVEANGADFAFYINDQLVSRVKDNSYSQGEVGFYLENFDETLAHIHYDTLTVSQIQPGQPQTPVEGLLVSDDFTDPTSGWPEQVTDTSHYGYHPPDFYHVEASAPNKTVIVSRPQKFTDTTIETRAFVDHTNTKTGDFRYGLMFRRSGDKYYAFVISPRAKMWYILKNSATGLEVLQQGAADSLRRGLSKDTADLLRVDAAGSNFVFHLNGKIVAQLSDADYGEGEIGFYVETVDESLVHVHYDTLTIRQPMFDKEPTAKATP